MSARPTEDSGDSLNRRMTRGAAWAIALRFSDRGVGLINTVILARLLVPADFGLVVLATAMVAAITIFGEFGFETALIGNQKAERRHYDTAWTLGLLRGLIFAAIILLLASPLARFFDDPRLYEIVLVFALLPLLEGCVNIGTVAFRKELALNKEFVYRIVPRIVSIIVTVAVAFVWRDYWALVIGIVTGRAARLAMSYAMHGYRPRISLAAWREIMGFSKWILVSSVTAFANQKAGTFVIAKFLDASMVGIYGLASEIANMASAELLAPIRQALFPGYAKLAHDLITLRRVFLDTFGILVLLAMPIALGIGLTADLFVPILLGPKWNEAIPLIEILAISGGLSSVSSHVQPLYLAMNRPYFGAYSAIGHALLYLPALVIASAQYGVRGAAIAHAIGHVAVLLGSLYLMRKLLRLSPREIWMACWRPLVACALMVIAVGAFKWASPLTGGGLGHQLILLAMAVVIGAAVYVGSVISLWRLCGSSVDSAEAYLLAYLVRMLRNSRFRRRARNS